MSRAEERMRLDPASIAGKQLPLDEETDLLVIGGGPAGLAAALEGLRQGRHVVLVDENPVPAETMGEDIPQLFGGAMAGAVRNRSAMLEAFVASDPDIAAVFDAGVDVRLGTACWGIYANGPSVGWLPGPVAGLMGESGAAMIGARQIVVATGRRDMGLAFPGWELPGVIGATAAWRLAMRYGALQARRAVVLGSGAETVLAARALRDSGVEIAAVVEHATAPIGPMLDGAELLCGSVIQAAEGRDRVEATVVSTAGRERRIACDTILLGVGTVPVIELLDAAGCRTAFSAERGGYVPALDAALRTTVPGVSAAGDCIGIWPSKSASADIARAEGRAAVAQAELDASPDAPGSDLGEYRLGWVRSCVRDAAGEPFVCRCEEVTAREIMELRPPRYLGWQDRRNRQLTAPANPDVVKRLTRAGMGVCQGRRCREQVAALLALASGVPLHEVPQASHRAPVRPMPLAYAAAAAEADGMAEHWDTWFGMAGQYTPYWKLR
jgi:thioredoxin reductase